MSIFGQVWVFSAIAFALGAFLAWVFLVRPARRQIRSLEERLVAREADLRRISEPALGAAGTAQGRTERADPFSDADEALAGTGGYGYGSEVGASDGPEPETSWLERDSLAGEYAGDGYEDPADDFHLADRPDDLEIPGDRDAYDTGSGDYDSGSGDEPGYGHEPGYDSGYGSDAGYAAAALDHAAERGSPDDAGFDATRYDSPEYDGGGDDGADYRGGYDARYDREDAGYDRAGDEPHGAAADYAAVDYAAAAYEPAGYEPAAYAAADYDAGAYDVGAHDAGAHDAGADDERTQYVAAAPGAGEDAPVSSVLDPDEMRSVPAADSADAESTQLIGPDSRPEAAEAAEADTPDEAAGAHSAEPDDAGRPNATGSALNPGAPFRPVTSFEATTELPVGAVGEGGDLDPSGRAGGVNTAAADPVEAGELDTASGEPDAAGDEATDRSERPGSLFEPTPVDDEGEDEGEDDVAAGQPVADDAGAGNAFGGGDPASNGSGEVPADPPAYAFGGPDTGPDEDPVESTNILPKRTPRQRPPGGFDAPKPVQPSMRAITRREPDAAAQSGSLFEPAAPGDAASSQPAAEPAADSGSAGDQAGQVPSGSQQLTKFVTPAGQVPIRDEAVSGQDTADQAADPGQAGAGQAGADRSADQAGADQADAEAPKAGPFGPGSAMPLPGGGSPSPEFTVKASVTALRYVTDAAPQYPRMVAEVWFRSPADAERVGFRPLA
ncbi:hypothetical protein GCM10009676_46150 [Prauserella halophila]|uniref:Uncharacterized protein n=1 Tax=Prauserella halophila TaxID=185641 RepID=A0ABP4HAS0_9PSEU|nr:hypothetical protein [Prauserella halophila]MCP2237915.1 hypothetical protein [Prauserella halophila]